MKCPTCPDTVLAISSREGIEIDYCPQCRGVWLDRGELDKLIEKAAPPQNLVRSQSDDYRKDHYYKKPKSFLSEIFD